MKASAALLFLLASPVGAQAVLPEMAALPGILAQYGKAAVVDAESTTLFDTRIDSVQNCTAYLSSTSIFEQSNIDSSRTAIALGSLSSDVRTHPWPSGQPVNVFLETADDDTTIATASRSIGIGDTHGKYVVKRWRREEIPVGSAKSADMVARTFGAAIARCGGHPTSPQIAARRQSRDIADSVKFAASYGADSTGKAVVKLCQDRVRDQLNVPSSASFPSDHMVVAIDSTTGALVTGKVEAANALGGRVAKNYICSFKLFGGTWVPERTPGIY